MLNKIKYQVEMTMRLCLNVEMVLMISNNTIQGRSAFVNSYNETCSTTFQQDIGCGTFVETENFLSYYI